MAKVYPQFRSSYSHEEMVEHFLLTPAKVFPGLYRSSFSADVVSGICMPEIFYDAWRTRARLFPNPISLESPKANTSAGVFRRLEACR
jgi:hypothetical protein